MRTVFCNYCNKKAILVSGRRIYLYRPDLKHLRFWYCKPCGAYVGCHEPSDRPLGKLANYELRKLRIKAHNCFDRKWRDGKMRRTEAYKWLAVKLNIPYNECHIGNFDEDMCNKVIEVL